MKRYQVYLRKNTGAVRTLQSDDLARARAAYEQLSADLSVVYATLSDFQLGCRVAGLTRTAVATHAALAAAE